MKNIKSKQKMSSLGRLPTELLEKIFLYSLNMELPRSSPVLGGKLSSAAVYKELIAEAFVPTWSGAPEVGDAKLQVCPSIRYVFSVLIDLL